MTLSDFKRLLRYDAWANAKVFAYTTAMSNPPPDAVKWLAHIAVAQDLWYSRVTKDGRVLTSAFEELTLDQAEARLRAAHKQWVVFLAQKSDADLEGLIDYVRSGTTYQSRLADILTHIITHSMYHRGQVSLLVRAAGGEPVGTDFIAAAREGQLD